MGRNRGFPGPPTCMNRKTLLFASLLAAASALAFVPTYAQDSDDQQDQSASDSSSTPIDLDKVHGPVYVIQDPSTGETYIFVPDAPVRGVTYWA